MMQPARYVAAIMVSVPFAVGAYFAASAEPGAEWVRVARDANYDIAIDTARIGASRAAAWGRWYKVYEVWYRTDHAVPRLHKGKSFNREIVRSIVQCDSLWFKVLSVDMSTGGGRVVARQRTSERELRDQPWRRVERGTTEEMAAIAACYYGDRRSRDAGSQGGTHSGSVISS